MGMWFWTDQKFVGGVLDFETEGSCRRWRERWPSKIDSNWGKHCCCCWFGQKDRRFASRMIAESLNIPKTIVLLILKDDLGKRKLCARFVPHSLSSEQREDRVTSCQDIIVMADADNFLNKTTRGDETWCFAYDSEKSNRILNELVKHLFGRRNWNSKGPASRPCW
jgi:hypothetical protein